MQNDQRNLSNHPKLKPDKAFRKIVWLQIYLPLIFIIFLVAGLVVVLWEGGVGSTSGWADAALVILMIPALLVGILILAIVAGLCYGVMYVVGWIPGPAKRVQEIATRVGYESRRFANMAVRPLMVPRAAKTAVVETIRYLVSIFSKEG